MPNRSLKGTELLEHVASQTGLPSQTMAHELDRLMLCAGLDSNVVSMDDLRRVLADYAQEILLAAKQATEKASLLATDGPKLKGV